MTEVDDISNKTVTGTAGSISYYRSTGWAIMQSLPVKPVPEISELAIYI